MTTGSLVVQAVASHEHFFVSFRFWDGTTNQLVILQMCHIGIQVYFKPICNYNDTFLWKYTFAIYVLKKGANWLGVPVLDCQLKGSWINPARYTWASVGQHVTSSLCWISYLLGTYSYSSDVHLSHSSIHLQFVQFTSWIKGTVLRKSMWTSNVHFSKKTTMVPFIWVWNTC